MKLLCSKTFSQGPKVLLILYCGLKTPGHVFKVCEKSWISYFTCAWFSLLCLDQHSHNSGCVYILSITKTTEPILRTLWAFLTH